MIALLVAGALALGAQDTVGVAVQLSQEQVAVDEVVVYDVTITTPGAAPDDVRLPRFPGGLQVRGTRRFDEYAIRFPGGRLRTTRLEVHLRPRRPGHYAIPPVVVVYDGRRYASRALTLEVLDAGSVRSPSGIVAPRVEGFTPSAVGPDAEALLRARLEPDTVYVGEQATLVVEALVSEDLRSRLRRAPEYMTPSVSGLWTQDLPDATGTHVEWSGGRRYDVQTFRRAYFPLEPGTVEVPEARLVYEARRGFMFTPYSEELTTEPLELVVLPLPPDNAPASFAGAVGDYSIGATLAPANLAVGDAALLTVVVRGEGNLKALPAPQIPDTVALAIDAPTEDAAIDPIDGAVAGRKTFTWAVVPQRAGIIRIGPIEYPFFDPDAGDYRVARSGVLTMEVAPAGPSAADRRAAREALAGLRTRPRPDPFGALRGPLGGMLAIAPVLFAAVLFAVRRSRARARVSPSRRVLRRRLHARFEELAAPDSIAEPRFFDEVEGAARAWLADRLAAPALRDVTDTSLAATLEEAGVGPTLAGALRDLLERFARARFQPVPPDQDERRRLLGRLRDALDRVDRMAPVPRPTRARRGTGTSAVVALVALAIPGSAAAGVAQTRAASPASSPVLEQIVGAHADGRTLDAANLARAYVLAQPRDASGWYDLGTIAAARGRSGIATWALLRALALDPRAADVRHNLDVLGVDDAARRAAAPALPLRPGETRALALAAWWVAALLGMVAVVRRGRGWIFGASAAGAVALVFGALLLAPRIAPDSAVPFDPAASLRAAPHLRAPVRTDAGSSMLRIVERRDGWLRVRDATGAEGWIERRQVGIIR